MDLHFFVDLLYRNGLANVDEIFQITYSGKGRMPVRSSPLLPMSMMLDIELIFNKRVQMREIPASGILYGLHWKHLKMHVTRIQFRVNVDTYPSGFNISSGYSTFT